MLAAESYRQRMETGLNFIEFNYMLLQAYDYLHLYRTQGCTLQMGGNDQWGNILAGADLIRRVEGGEAEALTFPLLTTPSGEKMGKTAKGAVWLDAERTSPYDYYQYWINVDDAQVGQFLGLFTFLPMEEVAELSALEGADLRRAKEILAFEATRINHGEEEAAKARSAAKALFSGGAGDDSSVPTVAMPNQDIDKGIPAFELFAEAGLVKSRSEARRLIKQGGAYINGRRVEEFDQLVTTEDLDEESALLLRAGKKKFVRIVPSGSGEAD
jgi:tyrosyl-tRNA synthetase